MWFNACDVHSWLPQKLLNCGAKLGMKSIWTNIFIIIVCRTKCVIVWGFLVCLFYLEILFVNIVRSSIDETFVVYSTVGSKI